MKILRYAVAVAVNDDTDAKGLGQAIELVLTEQIRHVKAAEVTPAIEEAP